MHSLSTLYFLRDITIVVCRSPTDGSDKVFIEHMQLYHDEFKKEGSVADKVEMPLFINTLKRHGYVIKRSNQAHCSTCKRIAELQALKKYRYPSTSPPTYLANGVLVPPRQRRTGTGVSFCATCGKELLITRNKSYFKGILTTHEITRDAMDSDDDV